MKKLATRTLALASLLALTACAGTRTTGSHGTTYATAFNLLGLQIPYDDYEKAHEMVPDGADVETVIANPRDWTSIAGILTTIFGFSSTQVSYEIEGDDD